MAILSQPIRLSGDNTGNSSSNTVGGSARNSSSTNSSSNSLSSAVAGSAAGGAIGNALGPNFPALSEGKLSNRNKSSDAQKQQGYMDAKQEQLNKGVVSTDKELAEKGAELSKAELEGAQNTANTISSNAENADTKPPLIPPNQFSKVKGMISIPSPMAHVWVMFEGGDPNYPIVLGNIFGKEDYHGVHDMTEVPANSAPVQPSAAEAKATDSAQPGTATPTTNGSAAAAADAQQRKVQGKRPGGYCYRGVKNALLNGGVVDNYLVGVPAKGAGPQLIANGFKKTNLTDPRQAPPGAVIVYSGGENGHIEMKTSDGGYVSDYYSRNPPSPRSRPVLGIYTK